MKKTFNFLLQAMSHGRYADAGLFLLRFGPSFLMAYIHGWDKLVHFGEYAEDFYDFLHLGFAVSLGLAVFSELVCSILLMLGLFTRLAAIPLLITMGVIVFDLNWGNSKLYEYESPLLYLFIYVILTITGAGKYSLDYKFFPAPGKPA